MAQLETSGRRTILGGNERRGSVGAGMKLLFALAVGTAVVTSAGVSRADGTDASSGTAATSAADERAGCMKRLGPAEDAIEKDYKYARAWTDSWTVASTSL